MIASLSAAHDLVRWLDDFRHFLAYSFSILNWVTNGSEQIIAIVIGAAISYMIWPKLRAAVNGWIKGHFDRHHEEIKKTLAEHHEAMKAHVAAEIAKIGGTRTPRK